MDQIAFENNCEKTFLIKVLQFNILTNSLKEVEIILFKTLIQGNFDNQWHLPKSDDNFIVQRKAFEISNSKINLITFYYQFYQVRFLLLVYTILDIIRWMCIYHLKISLVTCTYGELWQPKTLSTRQTFPSSTVILITVRRVFATRSSFDIHMAGFRSPWCSSSVRCPGNISAISNNDSQV